MITDVTDYVTNASAAALLAVHELTLHIETASGLSVVHVLQGDGDNTRPVAFVVYSPADIGPDSPGTLRAFRVWPASEWPAPRTEGTLVYAENIGAMAADLVAFARGAAAA